MENEQNLVEHRLPEYADFVGANSSVKTVSTSPNGLDSVPEETSKSGETEEFAGGLPNEIFVYRQDVVGCKNHEDKRGIVMEVAGDMDSEGSITDESDGEGDEDKGGSCNTGGDVDAGNNTDCLDGGNRNNSLSDGQVRVVWTDCLETTENVSDMMVVDRGFMHGDIVASAFDPTGQLGIVVDVSIIVDLQAANGEVIKNVSSRGLKRVREFTVGDYVVHGPWLGRVDDVLDNVTVMFDDGSVCKVVKADFLRLKPVSKASIDVASCPYYPGQRVRAVSSSVFRSSRWLSGLWKSNRLEGTVIKVQPGSVVVYWIASAYLGVGANSSSIPAEEQSPKNLTLLSCFSHANWQLGDWCLLPSPSLPSSYFCVENSTTNNLREPNSRHMSQIGECTDKESVDTLINSCIKVSEQALCVPNLLSKEHQTSELLFQEAATQEDIVKSNQVVSSDAHDLQTVSDHLSVGSSMNSLISRNLSQAQVSHTVQTKSGETNGTELISGLPDCGSCSSPSVPKESVHESWATHRKKLQKIFFKRDKKARKRGEDFERALCIINTVTKVDVAWQDGTIESRLDSKSLIPIHTPNDHEFFPEQFVVQKVTTEGDDSSETKRVGVVRSVNSKDRTVCVRWLKPVARPEDLREFDCEEVVSTYELDEHPDYNYCYGDVVVRLSPVSASGNKANYYRPMEEQLHQDSPKEAAVDVSRHHSDDDEPEQKCENESCANFTCLTWVGNITGFHDGDIEVMWANGMVSKVGPQAVYVVGQEDGVSFDGGSEISDDAASWETVDEDRMDSLNDTEKEADLPSSTDNIHEEEKNTPFPEEESNVQNGLLSMHLAALVFVTRLATEFFSRCRKQLGQSASSDVVVSDTESGENLKFPENAADCCEVSIEEPGALDMYAAQNKHKVETGCNYVSAKEDAEVKMEENLDGPTSLERNGIIPGPDTKDGHCSFKHFDIAENPLDHYFLSGNGQSTGGRKWVKKVHQEWSILEKNLPDDIYVRVFEDRMDLLRAVIIGAPGTPYQDGLFFFDFHLPPEYPQVPPLVNYHSGGLRINPNLYVEGKVCLSLLNTWTGRGNEVWDPSSSSILQVLVSLQGLVLNAKPYFNEAGYEKQVGTIEGEKNSLPYNENTYLLNLKSMMYLLRRPPMHFEDFVKDHFRMCGHYILKACEAYMNGCLIGSLTKDACMTEKSREQLCSVGFKLMLAKLLPRLMSALCDVGVDCQEFEHLRKT